MKKIFISIASLALCSVMLASCGDNNSASVSDDTSASVSAGYDETKGAIVKEDTQTSAEPEKPEETTKETEAPASETTETSALETTEAAASETTASETAASETKPTAAAASGTEFASIEDFIASDVSKLDYKTIAYSKSNTKKFVDSLENISGLYMDVEAVDGSLDITMAIKDGKTFLDGTTDGERIIMIINDGKLYILDPTTRSGFYMQADDEILEAMGGFSPDELISTIKAEDSAISDNDLLKVCDVSVNGKSCTFESSKSDGMLYGADGSPMCMIAYDDSYDISSIIINDFTGDVPADAFDIPEDYEIVDISEALE